MTKILKGVGIFVIIAILLIILERWHNIFYAGQLYDSIGLGLALIGFASPVLAIAIAAYFVYLIVMAKA